MYRIVRFFADSRKAGRTRRVIESGLTLQDAQEHCNDPEASSSTCTRADRKRITARYGPWFDGYEKM